MREYPATVRRKPPSAIRQVLAAFGEELDHAEPEALPSTPALDAVSVPTSSLPDFVAPPVEPLPSEACSHPPGMRYRPPYGPRLKCGCGEVQMEDGTWSTATTPPLPAGLAPGDPLADDPDAWLASLALLPDAAARPLALPASLPSVPAPVPRTPTPSRGIAADQSLWQRHTGLWHAPQDHRGKGRCPLCRDSEEEDETEEQEAQEGRDLREAGGDLQAGGPALTVTQARALLTPDQLVVLDAAIANAPVSPSPRNGGLAGAEERFRLAVLAVSEALDAIRARLDRVEREAAELRVQLGEREEA